MTTTTQQALADLAAMQRIRFLEEKITELRKKQIIQGSIHLCNGQEAIYVGSRGVLTSDDRIFSTYRGHGWAMACGVPAENILAELMGRETGVCKGRGGSAMFSAADYGFYGENSIVAAGAPIACGAALSAKVKGETRVALTAFGDGAMNQGGMHEAMNFAAYLDLAVIFVCENNTYAELTPVSETVRDADLYKRAAAYGMPGVRIDGNDVTAVRECVAHYASLARAGKGPALIEMMTQRLVGHYYGDMQGYRPNGEITAAKKDEPIVRLQASLLADGVSDAELQAVHVQAHDAIELAAMAALAAPMADTATVKEHLYA